MRPLNVFGFWCFVFSGKKASMLHRARCFLLHNEHQTEKMKPTILLTLSLVSLLVGAQTISAIHLGRDLVQPASPDLGDGRPGHDSAHSTMRSKLQKRSDLHLPLRGDGGGGIRSLRGGGCPGFYIMPKTHMPALVLAPSILSALGLIFNPTWCLESFAGFILNGRFASKDVDCVRFTMKNAGVRMLGLASAIAFLMYRDQSLGVPDTETLAGAFGVFSATMASLLLLLGMASGKEIHALGYNQYFPYIWSTGLAIFAGLFFTETAVRPAGYLLSLIGLYHGVVGLIAPEFAQEAYKDKNSLNFPASSGSRPRNWATRHAFSHDIAAAVIFLTLLHGGSVATALSYAICVCGLVMAYGIDTNLFGTRRSGFVLMTSVLYSFYTAISLVHGE